MSDPALREQLVRCLDWNEAHLDFDHAVAAIPPALRGVATNGLPYTAWQLLEHLRIAQHDILDFTVNAHYQEKKWPDDYWPSPVPPTATAWDESVAAYRLDRAAMQAVARDPSIDLFARIPHGTGQTYLREILLVIDHGAYHVGQLVLLSRLLGSGPS